MKVLNPNNTNHTITLQPRFNPTTDLVIELINEVSKRKHDLINTYTFIGGVLNLNFDFDVLENDIFTFKITENDVVIYRGSIFCTSQNTQDYKLTENKYIYPSE